MKDIRVSGGSLDFITKSGKKITANGLEMAIGDLFYKGPSPDAPYARVSLTGKIKAGELHYGDLFDAEAVELDDARL